MLAFQVSYMRLTAACLLLSLFFLMGCGNRFELGRLEYYRVDPRIPSAPTTLKENQDPSVGYTAVWGVLGTTKADGPIFRPASVRIGGESFPIVNWKYIIKDYRYYYIFEISGPLPDSFPRDMMTGNIFSQEPETRARSPIKVNFVRQHDQSEWIGIGTVEQSSMLQMQAVQGHIDSE